MLLGEGEIVSMENQAGEESVLNSDAENTELPYVILVNENSASASEILAGAVKDNTDNPLVGVTTFGKGIVQTSGQLDDGSALELTTMQYFSPNGNKIHKKGVKPDYVVKNTGTEDKQLNKAIELLK
jgi:carboxyl-terminal processing protease